MSVTAWYRSWLAGVALLAALAAPVLACPFCGMQGQTLTGEVNEATLVIFGTLTNPKLDL